MKKFTAIIILIFAVCTSAKADVWMWVDAKGDSHFVDIDTPIYTWLDEYDRVHFADRPEHKDAVMAKLVWQSSGSLPESADDDSQKDTGSNAHVGETAEEKQDRELAEKYCERAKEIYETYVNAPRLYKTTEDGEKIYLSDEEMESTLAQTTAKIEEWCN